MLVFVDESGDTGTSGKVGQSDYFVVALVLFEMDAIAEQVDTRIDELRAELGLSSSFEFHFHSTKAGIRERFLEAMVAYDWGFLAFVMNKRELVSPSFAVGDTLYKTTAQYVFENAKPFLRDAKVVIDKRGSARFRRELDRLLKASVNQRDEVRRIKRIKPAKSASNNLIQLADMISGAVYRSMLTGKKDQHTYRAIVDRKALQAIRIWP